MNRKITAMLLFTLSLTSILIQLMSFPVNIAAEEFVPVLKEAILVYEEWDNGYVQINEKVTYNVKVSLNNTWTIGTWYDVSIFDRFAAELMLDKVVFGSFVVEFDYENYLTLNARVDVSSNFGFSETNFRLRSSSRNPLVIEFPDDSKLTIQWKGKSWKIEYKFEFSSQLDEEEEVDVHFFDSTDMNPAGKQEYTSYCMHELNSGVTLKFRDINGKQFSAITGALEQYNYNDILRDNCVVEVIEYPETGNGFIGYEDWDYGDFDYNDFGMTFSLIEVYKVTNDHYLKELTMTFTATFFESEASHYIHIRRPLNGEYDYTVTRGTSYAGEKPAGIYSGSGELDVVLFNTEKYTWPQVNINETVIIHLLLDNPELNPKVDFEPPRSFDPLGTTFYDLDPIMAKYDPWIDPYNPDWIEAIEWHINDIKPVSITTFQGYTPDILPIGLELPFILTIPYTNWIPPYDFTTISGPYQYFDDFYSTGSHNDWYLPTIENIRPGRNITDFGGIAWGPYSLP